MSYVNTVLGNNPLGYWRLQDANGTIAIDSSTAALNGTINSTVSYRLSGPLNDGTISYSMGLGSAGGHNVTFQTGYADLTAGASIELWYKPDITSSTFRNLLQFSVNAATEDDQIQLTTGSPGTDIVMQWKNTTTARNIESGPVLVVGQWSHIVCSVDSTGLGTIYHQGLTIAGPGNGGGLPQTLRNVSRDNNGLAYGASAPGSGSYAEAAIYSPPLTNAQILNHYTVATTSPLLPGFPVFQLVNAFAMDMARRR